MSAILSGLLLNVALYALVRVKMIVDGSIHSNLAGHLMMGFGMLSFMVASLFLHRQRDIKRMFSYSSIEHMGLMTFAFGLGGPLATFAALLHMTVHSLTKSAIFITVGHAAQIAKTQSIEKDPQAHPHPARRRLGLLSGTVAIAGFPPFGVFTSEFLVLTATMKSWPWLTLPLLVGLGIASRDFPPSASDGLRRRARGPDAGARQYAAGNGAVGVRALARSRHSGVPGQLV